MNYRAIPGLVHTKIRKSTGQRLPHVSLPCAQHELSFWMLADGIQPADDMDTLINSTQLRGVVINVSDDVVQSLSARRGDRLPSEPAGSNENDRKGHAAARAAVRIASITRCT